MLKRIKSIRLIERGDWKMMSLAPFSSYNYKYIDIIKIQIKIIINVFLKFTFNINGILLFLKLF